MKQKRALVFICVNVSIRVSAHPPTEGRNSVGFIRRGSSGPQPRGWPLGRAHEVCVTAEMEGREEERLGEWSTGGGREIGVRRANLSALVPGIVRIFVVNS